MKNFFFLPFFLLSGMAHSQWAVYDSKVHEELRKINNVQKQETEKLKEFEKFERLDVDFASLTSLTDEDKKKFVGTLQDCGDDKANPAHYQACAGLRNLRLQTLKQSQSVLLVLDERRKAIDKLIEDARSNHNYESGVMQRYHFELQGLQAQMQADALKLQILMDGYRQREQVYAMQMNEARRGSDRGALDTKAGRERNKAVPFVAPSLFN